MDEELVTFESIRNNNKTLTHHSLSKSPSQQFKVNKANEDIL